MVVMVIRLDFISNTVREKAQILKDPLDHQSHDQTYL